MRTVLLNPGPVTLTDEVRNSLGRIDLCHREPEFGELTLANNARLERVYDACPSEFAAVTITGSGTAAVEAMLGAFCPVNGKTLVLVNGVYGERLEKMLIAMGRPALTISTGWDQPLDLPAVERTLAANPKVSHVAAVHHETTTGRLNDIDGLGTLCRRHERKLLLDAVSSFAAESIEFTNWNVQAIAATANKCLHGVPGISFVIASRAGLERERPGPCSVYLDLRSYYESQRHGGFSPFTQSVPAALALDVALDALAAEGGWQARRARYRAVGNRISSTLLDLGIETMLPASVYSSVMRSYQLPGDISYDAFHDALKASGFIVYAGQGQFAKRMFRIAHMGDIRDSDLTRLDRALIEFFEGAQ